MNIKKRLILFNTITAVVPFIVAALTMFVLIMMAPKIYNDNVNYTNIKKLGVTKSQLINVINHVSNEANLEDSKFHQYLYKKLSNINGELIITKNNDIIFSSKTLNKIDMAKCLEELKNYPLRDPIQIDNHSYIIDGISVEFKDASKGNVILLLPVEDQWDVSRRIITTVIIVYILSFIAINIFMSYLFSKRILTPINLLKNATSEISKGDLNFEVIETGDSEIKELCSDFEKMRVQLKDSIRSKIKYDDNRKMLVSSISHDLKTPITSIKGYVEGLLDGVANTPEKKERYLKTIYSKAEQMDAMIDDLLLYSKLDLNQLPFNYEKTNIIEYFNYCIEESAPELEKYNIEIELKNDLNSSKYVMIDRDRLRRVIINIIDNSRKYMDKEKGKIDIMLRETNSSIIIEMRDNGAGIDKSDATKIFDRFYRADLARTETKGSGLGLAIAKQIVEGHKGKIWAVSHEKEGTSVIISLAKIRNEL